MSAAQDGTILLSPATRAVVARQIAVEEQAPLKLKGLAAPVVPARVLYAFEADRGVGASAESSLSRPPLVGRDQELALLSSEAATALRGTGRVLALVGEAGAGKSRLTEELISSCAGKPRAGSPGCGTSLYALHRRLPEL